LKPETAGEQDLHRLGRVIAVGEDRPKPGEPRRPNYVEVGDLVYFQTNAFIAAHQTYEHQNKAMLNLLQTEIIAKVKGDDVSTETFEIAGEWVLVKPFLREGQTKIILPDSAKSAPEFVFYKCAQVGPHVDLPIKVGQELALNHGRVQPIFIVNSCLNTIQHEEFGYVHRDFVLGAIEDDGVESLHA
jgi:co-chaperonin GroES (HSP10)